MFLRLYLFFQGILYWKKILQCIFTFNRKHETKAHQSNLQRDIKKKALSYSGLEAISVALFQMETK